MRISEYQQSILKQTLLKHFSASSLLQLFGSRVDDASRGGDIDIYIEPEITQPDMLVDAKISALVELHKRLGDQKIDLVINRKQGKQLPIYAIAKQSGILL
jgi:predicted nucleotidyltransferase